VPKHDWIRKALTYILIERMQMDEVIAAGFQTRSSTESSSKYYIVLLFEKKEDTSTIKVPTNQANTDRCLCCWGQ
jgi:hypothetical protein